MTFLLCIADILGRTIYRIYDRVDCVSVFRVYQRSLWTAPSTRRGQQQVRYIAV